MSKAFVLGVIIQLLVTGQATGAESPRQRGARLSRQAMKLFTSGLYRQAITRFEASQAVNRHRSNLYFIGEAHRRLGQHRRSYEVYVRYAAHLPAEKRAAFLLKLDRLRQEKPCAVSLATEPASAVILMDGERVGATPGNGRPLTITVKGGKHILEVRREGHVPITRKLVLEFGEPQALSFALEARPATLRVTSDAPQTQVFIDGVSMGQAPVARVLKPGAHHVRAAAAGRHGQRQRVVLKPGQVKELTLSLKVTPPAVKKPPKARRGSGGKKNWTGNAFVGVTLGPALSWFGDDAPRRGPAIEVGLGGGYRWRGERWGLSARGEFLYIPIENPSGEGFASTTTLLFGGSVQLYVLSSLWIELQAGVGYSMLLDADRRSLFFDGADEVSGVFVRFATRAALALGWQLWRGLTLMLYPVALDFCERHGDFNPEIGHTLRLHFAAGLAWYF